jgi:cytochrome b561
MTINSMTNESESILAGATPVIAKPKRYHPALIALHWLIAIMIVGAVFLVQRGGDGGREGFRPGNGNFPPPQAFQPGNPPDQNFQQGNPPPQGGFPQQQGQSFFSTTGLHMIFGLTILLLLIIRLIVRWTTKHPEWASAGNKFLDWVGGLTHFGLYLLTFGMVITGIILADQRGQLARTFGIGGAPTRGGFGRGSFSLGMLHGGIWILLLSLIILHAGAALYHQFILKDNLLSRMWFGKQTQ